MSEDPIKAIKEIAQTVGGTIKEVGLLPDNSGFATMSYPLPRTHWIYKHGFSVPPMPFRLGTNYFFVFGAHEILPMEGGEALGTLRTLSRDQFAPSHQRSREVRHPLVVGMLGYWTANGLTDDAMFNPSQPFEF